MSFRVGDLGFSRSLVDDGRELHRSCQGSGFSIHDKQAPTSSPEIYMENAFQLHCSIYSSCPLTGFILFGAISI